MEALERCNHSTITSKLQHLKAPPRLSAHCGCTNIHLFVLCVRKVESCCLITLFCDLLSWNVVISSQRAAHLKPWAAVYLCLHVFSGESVVRLFDFLSNPTPLHSCIITLSFNPSSPPCLPSLFPTFPLGRWLLLRHSFYNTEDWGWKGEEQTLTHRITRRRKIWLRLIFGWYYHVTNRQEPVTASVLL